ncbi:MAG: hypothetical protein AAFV80_02295, partial [Bacteroidota bacterium]
MIHHYLYRFLLAGVLLTLPFWGFGQTILMSNGSSTTCSATFYDSGGPSGDYSSNETFVYTVCPDLPGECLWVDFTAFQTQLNTSPFGVTIDFLNVFDGPDVFSPLIQALSGDLNDFDFPVASSSGCLTFQFDSTNDGNEPGWEAEISCMPCPEAPIIQHQDCIGAIPVCEDRYFQPNSYSATGTIVNEINQANTCITNEEQNSQWLMFNVADDGIFRFMIHPLIPENYNWVLYDLTNAQCPETFIPGGLAPVLSCNASNSQSIFGTIQDRGITGANSQSPFNGSGNSNNGNQDYINGDIPVTAGQILLLAIVSGNATQGGFFLDASDSDPQVLGVDDNQPELREVLLPDQCGEDEITLVFNEHLDCASVDASDFTIVGPGGPYTVVDVLNQACTTTPFTEYHEKFFRLEVAPPFTVAGSYQVIMNGTLIDNCGNTMAPFDSTFVIDLLDADAGGDLNLCLNDAGTVSLGGSPANPLGGTAVWTANPVSATSFLSSDTDFNPSITISNLPEGNLEFYLEIDDGNCLAYDTIMVSVIDCSCDLTVNLLPLDVTCNGAMDGQIQSTVSGGTMPYTYTWTGGIADQANPAGLDPGTYEVTVTSTEGCIGTASALINEPSPLLVTEFFTNPTCGTNNGSFQIFNTAGGITPYTYDFGNGQGTNTEITDLGPGFYAVTVSDNNGCFEIRTVDLIDQPGASITINTLTNTSDCGSCDGGIDVNVNGGSTPYTYNWENSAFPGVQVGNAEDIAGLCAGTYCLTLTDANACESVFCETVAEPGGPQVMIGTITPESCEQDNGAADLMVSGGTGSYVFAWENLDIIGLPTFSGNPVSNLPGGNYSVTVTNADGSCPIVVGLSVPEVQAPQIDQLSATSTTCGSSNGTLSALVSAGTGSYLFNWENALNPGVSVSTTNPATGLIAGDYSVTVTNDDGTCPVTGSVNLPDVNDLSLTVDSTPENCSDMDGTASVSVAGGSGNYQFQWDDPTSQTTAIATGLSAGSYSITVIDNNGGVICTAFESVDVLGGFVPVIDNIIVQPESCGALDGSIVIETSGGTGDLIYNWTALNDPSLILSNDSVQTMLLPGDYQLVLTNDDDTCPLDTIITVASIGGPNIDSVQLVPEVCSGVDGSISLFLSGGIAPYTFTWEDPLNPSIPLSNSPNLLGLAAGTYLVTVVSADGSCPISTSFDVMGTSAPTIDSFQVVDDNCSSFTGSITLFTSASADSLSYVWVNDAMTMDTLGTDSTLTGITNGSYTVTVSNPDGSCAIQETDILIGGTQGPIIDSFFIDPENCNTADGRIGLTVSRGIPPYTFDWEDLGDPANFLGLGDTIGFLTTGEYAVSIYNVDSSCVTIDTFFVPFIEQPVVDNIVTTLQSCDDEDGTILISVSGGLPPYNFNWTNASNPGGSVGNDSLVTGLEAGTYQYQIENANGRCDIIGLVDVGQAPAPVLQNILATNITCVGNDGTMFALVSGGLGNLQFNWERTDTPGVQVGNTSLITGLTPGNYAVTITNEDGSCPVFGSNFIGGVPDLVIVTNSTDVTCNGFNNGTATVGAGNGNPPFQFQWSTGSNNATIQNLAPGQYTVTVTNNDGCIGISSVNILEPSPLGIASTANTPASCTGGSDGTATAQAIGGTAPYTYQWDAATGGQIGSTATGLSTGIYSFIVTDANGCVVQGPPIVITEPENALVGELIAIDISCPEADDGIIMVTASGGVPDYQFPDERIFRFSN